MFNSANVEIGLERAVAGAGPAAGLDPFPGTGVR